MSKRPSPPHRDTVAGRPRGEGAKRRPTGQGAAAKLAVPRAATTAARTPRVVPLQSPPGQKRGHNLVPGRAGPHARFAKTKPAPLLPPTGAVPRPPARPATTKTASQAANKRASKAATKTGHKVASKAKSKTTSKAKTTKKTRIHPPKG